jgi:hypothetical protein
MQQSIEVAYFLTELRALFTQCLRLFRRIPDGRLL